MPGAGSKLAITTDNPPVRLLDLTRLVRRAGRRMTGVDRVEHAYLVHLLALEAPLFGLVRTALGFALLDRAGCAALCAKIGADDWGPVDLLSRGLARRDAMRARAESDVRRLAVARSLAIRLEALLTRLPEGFHYLNTGHSNLTDRVLAAVRARRARVAVLVHDTIPLDTPEFQRPETLSRFRAFLRRAGRSDLIICNSHQTEADVRRHLARWDLAPQTVVAHLGVPVPQTGVAPEGRWQGQPYFVTLGTIEPRKNHALLLDLWERMDDPPHLLICGARGWENAQVFDRLDRGIARVHELAGLEDGAVFALLQGSCGLLFPSLAEGYGLPPIEAAALGVPVVCNDLAIYREVLGDIPVYADVNDRYLWEITIFELARAQAAGQKKQEGYTPPDWSEHFNTVLTAI